VNRLKFILIAVVLIALAACGDRIEPGRTEAPVEPIKGLVLEKVQGTSVTGSEAFVATVESLDRSLLSARIDGRVRRILVTEGERVTAGQQLLMIDDNPAGDRVREAEAALAEASGGAAAAEARWQLAQKTQARFQRLFAKEAVTAQEFDQVNAELEMARQGRESARATVRRAKAGLAAAETARSYGQVTAPYAAIVAQRNVEEGSTVMPGTPLLTLDREGHWQARAELPEAMTGKVAVGAGFTVEIPALKQNFNGVVSEIIPAADPRSRSFQIKIELPDDARLVSGLFARVRAAEPARATLLVPATAIVTRGQLTAVYVVENDLLRYRLVKIGRNIGDRVEILAGLNEGETLVAADVVRAKNGARVED